MIFTSNFQHILNEYIAAYILAGAATLCVAVLMVLVAHGVGYRRGMEHGLARGFDAGRHFSQFKWDGDGD